MYTDLIASDTYISINRKLAQIFDLKTAAYVAELANIVTKVTKKKTFDDDGFFAVNRKYVEERTTLDLEDQLKCDDILGRAGILQEQESDKNKIRMDIALLTSLITSEDVKLLADVSKKSKATKLSGAAAKKAAIVANMKKCVIEQDLDMLQALYGWVDAVYANNRFLTKESIKVFQDTVNSFSADKMVRLKLIEIAMIHGWQDATWAIKSYNTDYAKNPAVRLSQQKIGKSVSSDVTF